MRRSSVVSPWPAGGTGGRPRVPAVERLRVLLVEDDDADAFLVSELLSEADAPFDLRLARSLGEATTRLAGVDCILLDLGLPDAEGIDGLRRVLAMAGSAAVCVLTGLGDEQIGVDAVAEGAQDYLLKGQVDGTLLTRALRYAVERKRADEAARRLREAEIRQFESARLERGLLPHPLMRTDAISVHTFYRPGRSRAVLGGDFYDVVQTSDDVIHTMVGDVCGHGVEEAALGVELRVAWRALVLGGVADDAVLDALEQVLASERRLPEIFATVATVRLDLGRGTATVRLAGHPPPVLLRGGEVEPVPAASGLVLGVRPGRRHSHEFPLGADWALLLYTDGLIEGRAGDGEERLDLSGLCDLLARPAAAALPPVDLPAWLVGQAEAANGGPLADDVAMLLIGQGRGGAHAASGTAGPGGAG